MLYFYKDSDEGIRDVTACYPGWGLCHVCVMLYGNCPQLFAVETEQQRFYKGERPTTYRLGRKQCVRVTLRKAYDMSAVIESRLASDATGATAEILEAPQHLAPTQIKYDMYRWMPFIFFHGFSLAAFWVGINWAVVGVAVGLYYVRMFAVTAFYHRYFSHRTFKTNRFWQFVFAIWGMTSIQKGPLWWAAHHRHHHAYSDKPNDLHSVRQQGFLWAHIGWICSNQNIATHYDRIEDLAKYPELRFLNDNDWLVPAVFGLSLIAISIAAHQHWPTVFTTPMQLFVWGFFISTVMLFHGTFTINSLSHVFGSKRYPTTDDSRNNWALAILTLGEGWHNNHHYFPSAVRQGFYWWEIDPTYYVLKVFSWLGIVWDLNPVPEKAYKI